MKSVEVGTGFARDSFRARLEQWLNADGLAVRYFTSSGSVPVGLPAASSVIFSTRASAWRSSSSQRRLSASPRS